MKNDKTSFKNKKFYRFKITIHPLFLILGVVLLFVGQLSLFLITTFSALLHELGHFLVADKLGYKMTRIRLMPFGAELFGDFDSFYEKDEMYVAIAGPIVNFCFCIVILSLWWVKPAIYNVTEELFFTNLVMGLFNLLPIFPLDGGRIVLCKLSKNLERKKAAKLVKNITKIFAIMMFILFILTIFVKINLTFGIMAFMLYFTASSNFKDATYQKIELSSLVKEKFVEWVFMSVPETSKIYELRKRHVKNKVIVFLVLDAENNISYTINELELENLILRVNLLDDMKTIKKILFNNNNNSMFIIDKNKIM